MTPTSRLYRSSTDRMICGVSGGLAEYLAVDPAWVRLTWIVLCFLTGGTVILAYVLLCLVLPEERAQVGNATPASADPKPSGSPTSNALREEEKAHLAARRELGPEYEDELVESFVERLEASEASAEPRRPPPKKTRPTVLAWLLIIAGVVVVLASSMCFSWFYAMLLLPLALIGLGTGLLIARRRH